MSSSLICIVILPAVLRVGPALAQEKPDAPKPKHDRKVFAIEVSLLAARNIADAVSTRQLLDRRGYERNLVGGVREPYRYFASGEGTAE